MTLEPDYDLDEVAAALGMSAKWVRKQVSLGAAHQRYGHKIRFTANQVEELRANHATAPADQSMTTGRKKRAS